MLENGNICLGLYGYCLCFTYRSRADKCTKVKETVKVIEKLILENPNEAKDIAEDIVEVVSEQEPSLPSHGFLPSLSSLPCPSHPIN